MAFVTFYFSTKYSCRSSVTTFKSCYLAKKTQVSKIGRIQPVFPGGGSPYKGLYGEAPPKRGTFFTLEIYKRVRISQVDVYKRVGKSVIEVFKGAFNHNISNRSPSWLYQFIY